MEIWDLYNLDGEIIGEHIRGSQLPENGYHLVVHIWIRNSKGQYLMTKLSEKKKTFPLKWECVGGPVLLSEALTDEVAEVKWMNREEILELHQRGDMVSVIKDLSYFIDNTSGDFQ